MCFSIPTPEKAPKAPGPPKAVAKSVTAGTETRKRKRGTSDSPSLFIERVANSLNIPR